jgi:hypothetical protein
LILQTGPNGDFAVTAMEKVTVGIDVGAQYAKQGIEIGAKYVVAGVSKGGDYLKSKISPNETPAQVSPSLQRGLKAASQVTPIAVTSMCSYMLLVVMLSSLVVVAVYYNWFFPFTTSHTYELLLQCRRHL